MSSITPRPGQNPDSIIRKFKKKVEAEGILEEIRKRQYFLTKSEKKRLKHKRAVARLKKEQENG